MSIIMCMSLPMFITLWRFMGHWHDRTKPVISRSDMLVVDNVAAFLPESADIADSTECGLPGRQ
eukprot:1859622-Amphidinium_carterae.1